MQSDSKVIVVKKGSKYWGWDSFKSKCYLTDKEHAENFCWVFDAQKWMDKHKLTGEIKEVSDSNF